MKEATGELNISVIVVIIVAMLSFFFFSFLWPMIEGNFEKNTKCDQAICKCNHWNGSVCTDYDCYYKDKNGVQHSITCSWKG